MLESMSPDIFEFIGERKQELAAETTRLRERLAAIEAEMEMLRRAETAARNMAAHSAHLMHPRPVSRHIKPNTIMADVLEVLEKHPEGLIALDILRKLNEDSERAEPLVRTSLSPQLSRLKQAGFIDLDGAVWKLVSRNWRSESQKSLFEASDKSESRKTIEAANAVPEEETSAASNPSTQQDRERSGGGT
jgi:hypothetical protein